MHQQNGYSKELVNRILQDYIDKIFAFALKRTMNRVDAEDLAQDIVVEILRSASSLKDVKAFHGWIWSIAKNTWKRWLYKKNKQPIESIDGINMILFDDNESLEDTVIVREDINALRREIALLSQIQRCVTVMYYVEEKNCEEISDILNISKGMVKQHLFKVRKLLKDGMNMVREYGEKSYNPKDFVFGFWGELGTMYFKMFERKIPKNIVMSAYLKPITIEEMSVDIGISRPYLEDELKILLDGDVISQNKDGMYQTNFIIILKELQDRIDRVFVEKCEGLAVKLFESFNKNEKEIRDIGFVGANLKWEKLLWTFIPMSLFLALNKIQSEIFNEPPLLKTGIRGWPNARERKPQDWDFGAYNHSNPDSKLGYWSCNFNIIPKNTTHIFGPSETELKLLNTLYDGERKISEYNDNEVETLSTLIAQGYIRNENKVVSPEFIGLDNVSFPKLIYLENQERTFVYDELKHLLNTIVGILEREVPKHLSEQIECHAFLSLMYIVSHVMSYLNNNMILSTPQLNERNTTAFCMFKDSPGLIP